MTSVAFLFIAVVLSVLGSLVLWARTRGSTSVDNGVEEFQREMKALSPDQQRRPEDRGNG
ncbi:MAG: hypothetical protein QOI47_1496 [Actinomycetota bacterium]|nr:hypothetical protein [Actinomycetota bacterium]